MWRANLHSVVVVAVVSMGLALNGAHVRSSKWFRGIQGFAENTKGMIFGVHAEADELARPQPEKTCAGPTCVLVAAQGVVLGLDSEGFVSSCDSSSARSDLPVLTGFLPATKLVGDRVCSAEIVMGLEIIGAFEDRPEVMRILSEVNLGDLDSPKVILIKGVTVYLGQGDYRRKVEKLNQVLLHLNRLKASPKTIDLRFARQVVVKCDDPKRSIDESVDKEV